MDDSQRIAFSRPTIGEEEIADVVDCLRSGWITSGPRVAAFEKAFAERLDVPHAVSVTSATAGLHLAMLSLDLSPGDEIVTTPMTWPTTVNAIVLAGGKPVLADIEPDTLNIDVGSVASRMTAGTKAIVPVHFAGQPVDLDNLRELTRARGIALIEDAAHAIGTEYHGRPIGWCDQPREAAVFSFHPIKNITTGEGGMVTTADESLGRRLRLLRFHGVDRDAWRAYGAVQLPHYDVVEPGFKYNLTDIQAAIGLGQLRRLDAFIERRKDLADRYDRAFADTPEIQPLARVPGDVRHAHHLYVVRVARGLDRDEVMRRMIASGVGLGLHFLAVHLMSYYQRTLGDLRDELPNATDASERIMSLPLYPQLRDDQQDRVVEVLRKVVAEVR